MALNLWTLGGQPANFNPIPSNHPRIIIGLGEYHFSCMARSATGGKLNVVDDNSDDLLKNWTLTNEFKLYEASFKSTKQNQNLWVQDFPNRTGDIEIKDIQLVEKPLGAATINGIDGFASGKWSLHANAKVLDDETLELNATGAQQISFLEMRGVPDAEYIFSFAEGTWIIGFYNSSGGWISNLLSGALIPNNTVFKAPANTSVIRVSALSNLAIGKITFKRPMLNLGSTPAPYSKKTGTRMVKPVARKNIFDTKHLLPRAWDVVAVIADYVLKPNTDYTLSTNVPKTGMVYFGDSSTSPSVSGKITRKSPLDGKLYVAIPTGREFTADLLSGKYYIQLEEGTTATPHEPYAVQINAKPQKPVLSSAKGLMFDGVRDYLQLPSMTMDSIELDCKILASDGYRMIVDARDGLPNGYFQYLAGVPDVGAGWAVNSGIMFNQRTTISLKSTAPFTDDVMLFARYSNFANKTPAILYGVKCYLSGQLIAAYDFTQPGAVVGDKVIPNAVNLIPSFEDARWVKNANFRVLGRDVGRLDATAAFQATDITLPVVVGKTYVFQIGGDVDNRYASIKNKAGVNITSVSGASPANVKTFVATENEVKLRLENQIAGTYNFLKPQLYELPASPATVVGAPSQGVKPSKRTRYAFR